MALRNFWIEGFVDGRQSRITGGPQCEDGGFSLVVYQRNKGVSMAAIRLAGYADSNGNLHLFATDKDGNEIKVVTER